MKKLTLLISMCIVSVVMSGCWLRRNTTTDPLPPQPPVVVDVVDPEPNNPTIIVDSGNTVEIGEDVVPRDELDENGEFDPAKFQDDDIDAVMQLLKELTAE